MNSLYLVNPRRKRRTGRMPAGLRRYWASRRRGRTSARKSRRRARAPVVFVNPRARRRRRTHRVHRRARRRNPIFKMRRHRRRYRNPFSVRGVTAQIMPALIGAGGAILTGIAYTYVAPQLPASLQTGYMPLIAKMAVAFGVGWAVGKVMGRAKGQAVTLGGLTVVAVQGLQPLVAGMLPAAGGGGVSDYQPYRLGAYMTRPAPGMGAYMKRPNKGGFGFYSPAQVVASPQGVNYNNRPALAGWSGYENDGM